MTVEFLEGKRKKFISPVTLFLFINLIYFFVSPLSDYSLSLGDQITQFYGNWAKEWIKIKLQNEGLDWSTYVTTYQNASDNISKSIMIINIPLIAFFVYIMALKRRPFYYDSLIFTFHFFSLFMFSWIMLDWSGSLLNLFIEDKDLMVYSIVFKLFTLIIPLMYSILGIKKLMNIHWYWAIPAGVGIIITVMMTNIIYRFIVFMITFWFT